MNKINFLFPYQYQYEYCLSSKVDIYEFLFEKFQNYAISVKKLNPLSFHYYFSRTSLQLDFTIYLKYLFLLCGEFS